MEEMIKQTMAKQIQKSIQDGTFDIDNYSDTKTNYQKCRHQILQELIEDPEKRLSYIHDHHNYMNKVTDQLYIVNCLHNYLDDYDYTRNEILIRYFTEYVEYLPLKELDNKSKTMQDYLRTINQGTRSIVYEAFKNLLEWFKKSQTKRCYQNKEDFMKQLLNIFDYGASEDIDFFRCLVGGAPRAQPLRGIVY